MKNKFVSVAVSLSLTCLAAWPASLKANESKAESEMFMLPAIIGIEAASTVAYEIYASLTIGGTAYFAYATHPTVWALQGNAEPLLLPGVEKKNFSEMKDVDLRKLLNGIHQDYIAFIASLNALPINEANAFNAHYESVINGFRTSLEQKLQDYGDPYVLPALKDTWVQVQARQFGNKGDITGKLSTYLSAKLAAFLASGSYDPEKYDPNDPENKGCRPNELSPFFRGKGYTVARENLNRSLLTRAGYGKPQDYRWVMDKKTVSTPGDRGRIAHDYRKCEVFVEKNGNLNVKGFRKQWITESNGSPIGSTVVAGKSVPDYNSITSEQRPVSIKPQHCDTVRTLCDQWELDQTKFRFRFPKE